MSGRLQSYPLPNDDGAGPTPAWTRLRPHPVQRALWYTTARFVAVPAGRGAGKTELAKRRLVRHLIVPKPWPDPRYFYAADTLGHAKEIAWNSLLALIPRSWIAHKGITEAKDALEIRTVFGSSLRVLGMVRPQRIEGLQWDGGVVDESSDCPPGIFARTVVPALAWRNGWCWRIGVPKRSGIGAAEFRKFFEDAAAGRITNAAGYTWPSREIVPPETVEWARRHLDPRDFREQFEATFERAGGAIFYTFEERENVRPCPYRPEMPICVGCDFNVDPLCWCLGHRFGWGIEWFDELFLRDTTTRGALDVLWARYGTHRGGWEFYCDASAAARQTATSLSDLIQIANDARLREAGMTIRFPRRMLDGRFEANPALRDRFAACNALLLTHAGMRGMFVDPRCVKLIDDLRNRHYKPGTSEPNDVGDLGHMTDAMGYVVWRLFPVKLDDPLAHGREEVMMKRSGTGADERRIA